MLRRLTIPFEWIIILIVLVSHVYVALAPTNSMLNWYTTDDAFYYFKTAQNIVAGHGATFDGIGSTNGFHPLWMLVCVAVFAAVKTDLILPLRIIVLILGLLNAGTGVLLYRLLRRALRWEVAAVAALTWVLLPRIHSVTTQLGMESGINAFFIVLLLYLVANYEQGRLEGAADERKLLGLGLVAVLTLFSRLDNIFLIGAVGIWLVFRSPRVRYLLLGDLVLIPVAVVGSYFARLGLGLYYYQYSDSALWMVALAVVVKVVVYAAFGLYQSLRTYSPRQLLLRSVAAATLSTLVITAGMVTLFSLKLFIGFPRAALLFDWAFSLALLLGSRGLARALSNPAEPVALPISPVAELRREWKRLATSALYFFAPIALALLAYMAWNWVDFGTPMPVSGQVKRWWGTLANTVYGRRPSALDDYLGLRPDSDTGPWSLATTPFYAAAEFLSKTFDLSQEVKTVLLLGLGLVAVGLVVVLLRPNRKLVAEAFNRLGLMPLWVGGALHVFSYKASSYIETIRWYWVGEMLLVVMLGAVLLEALFQILSRRQVRPWVLRAAAAALSLLLLFNFTQMITSLVPSRVMTGEETAYLGGAQALERMTEPGSLIGSTCGGTLAYFITDRTIINMDGLSSSYEYFQMLQQWKGQAYMDKIGLDYVYGNKYVVVFSDPYWSIAENRLELIDYVAGSYLYHYRIPAGPAQ